MGITPIRVGRTLIRKLGLEQWRGKAGICRSATCLIGLLAQYVYFRRCLENVRILRVENGVLTFSPIIRVHGMAISPLVNTDRKGGIKKLK